MFVRLESLEKLGTEHRESKGWNFEPSVRFAQGFNDIAEVALAFANFVDTFDEKIETHDKVQSE